MSRFLTVPIDVAALVLSGQPFPDETGLAPPLISFGALPFPGPNAAEAPFVSEAALAGPFEETERVPSEPGIHVHWAMPDALTRATRPLGPDGRPIPGSPPRFPELPDRWIVTRIARAQGQPDAVRSWIVDSRFLAAGTSRALFNAGSGAVPWLQPGDGPVSTGQPFRYLGRAVPLQDWAYVGQPGDPFLNVLNATSFGSVALAAYYPNTRNVFGLYDSLEDLADATQPAALCYAVTGWHTQPADDPVAGLAAADLAAALQRLEWAAPDLGPLDGTAYCGLVHSVGWNPQLLPEGPSALTATIGNTGSEALSALMVASAPAARMSARAGDDDLELQLHTFLTGQLPVLGDVAGPRLVTRQLHKRRFSPVPGSLVWFARRQRDGNDVTATLSPALTALLADLNRSEAEADALKNRVAGKQWQVFADWYKYLVTAHPPTANPANPAGIDPAAVARFMQGSQGPVPDAGAPLPDLEADLAALGRLRDETEAKRRHLAALLAAPALADRIELAQKPGDFFWQPADPTLLLSGPDVVPALRYGGDGLHAEDGTLACRTSDRLVATLTTAAGAIPGAPALSLDGRDAPSLALDTSPSGPIPRADLAAPIQGFLTEALLLWPDWAAARLAARPDGGDAAVWTPWLVRQEEAFLSPAAKGGQASPGVYGGAPPSPVGIEAWSGNPWLPIMMHWQVDYWPAQLIPPGSPTQVLDPKLILSRLDPENHSLDGDGTELVLRGDVPAAGTSYSGIDFITPHASFAALAQLKAYAATNRDSPLGRLAAALTPMSLLSQSLTGFHDRFLLRRKTLQVGIRDPFSPPQAVPFVERVKTAVEAFGTRVNTMAPMVQDSFCPVRAGFLDLAKLWLVDAFGQYRAYAFAADAHRFAASRALSTARMFSGPAAAAAFMPPRISQAAALDFRWMPASPGGAPSDSPIFGWIVPNYLDGTLMIYDSGGTPLGSVTGIEDRRWIGSPANVDTFAKDAEAVFGPRYPHLSPFVLALLAKGTAYLAAFLDTLNDISTTVQPLNHAQSTQTPILVGQPLALVRASVTLRLMSDPAINNTWQAFQQDMQGSGRTTNGHEAVAFPVLLGSVEDPDDGLFGFYDDDAFETFHSVLDADDGPIPGRRIDTVSVSVAGGPRTLSMIVDPRCHIHATTGYMPTQSLQVPTALVDRALSRMSVTFLTAPVLAEAEALRAGAPMALPLPLPGEQTGDWTWMTIAAVDGNQQTVVRPAVPLKPGQLFRGQAYALTEGWLCLQEGE